MAKEKKEKFLASKKEGSQRGWRTGLFAESLLALSFLFAFAVSPIVVFAAPAAKTTIPTPSGVLKLSVEPPLFRLNLHPGEIWQSYLTLVNDNPYDLKLYLTPVEVKVPEKDRMGSSLSFSEPMDDPLLELASWFDLSQKEVFMKKGSKARVPIAVKVPIEAIPGDYQAAVLAGNQPFGPRARHIFGLNVTTQASTVFALNVTGDADEKGYIRELSVGKFFAGKPYADIQLVFGNKGNVYMRPYGSLTLYNQWGTLDEIQIEKDMFGLMAPETLKRAAFTWGNKDSVANLWNMGMYRILATMYYGKNSEYVAKEGVYFVVFPIIPLVGVIMIVIAGAYFFRRKEK